MLRRTHLNSILNGPFFIIALILSLFIVYNLYPLQQAEALTATITGPTNGQLLSGDVDVTGEVYGDQYYLEYGAGAAPTTWQWLGSNPYTGLKNGLLAILPSKSLALNGQYTVRLSVYDTDLGTSLSDSVTINLDNTRPKVIAKYPRNKATGAPETISLYVYFDKTINSATINNSTFYLKDGSTLINGVTQYDAVEKKATLTVNNLVYNNSYEVHITSGITDNLGNKLVPLAWSFTTRSMASAMDPHGSFTSNVNTCVNCHGTHNASSGKLVTVNIEQYCNSCHDGTSAPRGIGNEKANRHKYVVSNNAPVEVSCNSCHNPHLPPSVDNFNLLKDYYYYDHADAGTPDSSDEKLCENCHNPNVKDGPLVSYYLYQYEQGDDSTGTSAEYTLCFRCHKVNGLAQSDILQYYEPGQGHFIKSIDASKPVGWKMPCADCHNKHGSNNLKLINEKLGQDNPVDVFVTGTWDAAAQREVCRGCHNNSTEMYGVTITLPAGPDGHQVGDGRYCTQCHGGSALKGAHEPG